MLDLEPSRQPPAARTSGSRHFEGFMPLEGFMPPPIMRLN
jgi:hypothetical protein